MLNSFHTIYRVHDRHGVCGMCNAFFQTKWPSRKEYFCNPCRSKDQSVWQQWMFDENAKAKGLKP